MKARLPRGSSANHGAVKHRRLPPWATVVGRLAFGVAAPLVCFGALLAVAPDLWLWPMALFVLTCVAAYVTSWLRAPRDDAFDAALRGAMVAATAFGALWGLCIGALTYFPLALLFAGPGSTSEFAPLVFLGLAAPAGFIAYFRLQRSRWPHRARSQPLTAAALAGLLGPGAACFVLFVLIVHRAKVVERRVVASPAQLELSDLYTWRWIAPGHAWHALVDAHGATSDARERERLAQAYAALTGDPMPIPYDF